MSKTSIPAMLILPGCLILFGLSALAQSQSASADQKALVNYDVSPDVAVKARTPTPGPDAKRRPAQAAIGEGKARVTLSKDSRFWVEDIDLDWSGQPVESQLLWDETNKVLYTYADKPFTCAGGSTESVNFLVAMFGKNNPHKKPAGSGWWAANLISGKCQVEKDVLYGCRFDAIGRNTACGEATLNERTNELTITTVTPKKR